MTYIRLLDEIEAYAEEVKEEHGRGYIGIAHLQARLLKWQEFSEFPPTNADHDKFIEMIGNALILQAELNALAAQCKPALWEKLRDAQSDIGEQIILWASAKTRKEAEDMLSREEWVDGQ